jgi:hypothetical protein
VVQELQRIKVLGQLADQVVVAVPVLLLVALEQLAKGLLVVKEINKPLVIQGVVAVVVQEVQAAEVVPTIMAPTAGVQV